MSKCYFWQLCNGCRYIHVWFVFNYPFPGVREESAMKNQQICIWQGFPPTRILNLCSCQTGSPWLAFLCIASFTPNHCIGLGVRGWAFIFAWAILLSFSVIYFASLEPTFLTETQGTGRRIWNESFNRTRNTRWHDGVNPKLPGLV